MMSTNTSPMATETSARAGRRVTGFVGRAGAVRGAGGIGNNGGWGAGGAGSSSRFIDPSDLDPDVVLLFHRPTNDTA
jgi:hypothetical protein